MKFILWCICIIIECMIGASCIHMGIESFKKKRYFMFGMNLYGAIIVAIMIINIIWVELC